MAKGKYALPPLNYAYDALEPYISSQIMTLHHSKHHQTYVNGLNAALESQAKAAESNDIRAHLGLQEAIKFNAGGHINHSLFWENLTPASSGGGVHDSEVQQKAPRLHKALSQSFGSLDAFKAKLEALLLGIKGSGWGWLVADETSGGLEMVQTKDQDIVPAGKRPLLGVDMWEHAYYLQYLNGKADYVKAIWNVINWDTVEKRLAEGEWWSKWQPLKSQL